MAKWKLSDYDSSFSTPVEGTSSGGYFNTTLDDLEKDQRFQETAERFLSSVGERSDDIFEYLRDSDYNLYSGFSRAMESKKWSIQQQRDYNYLRNRFGNADMGSLKQYLSATKDIGIDIATDPLAIAAVLLSPVTGGLSVSAKALLTKGATQGLKNLSKSQIKTKIAEMPIAQAKKLGAKQIGKVAGFTAVEGATWTGLDNHFRQETELNTQLRQLYSRPELVGSTALGALFGGLIGAGTQAGSIYYSKLADKFSDGSYVFNNDLIYNLRRKKDVALASTVGKPTAVLNNISAYSSTADELRKVIRYDAGKTFTSKTRSRLDWSYGERVDFRRGDYKMLYEGIIAPLYKTGRMNPAHEEAIIRVMRGDNLDNVAADIGLNVQEKDIVRNIVGDQTTGLRGFFNKIVDDADDAGIPVNKIEDYFPRSWNRKAIEKNEDGFIDLLVSRGVIETRKEAQDVVEGMLNKQNELFSSHSNLITQKRIFKDLQDNDFTEFLNNGLHDVSTKYFLEAARVIERKKAFGLRKGEGKPFTITRVKSETKEKTEKLEGKRKYAGREATEPELVTTKTKEDIVTLKSMSPEEEFIERWLNPIDREMRDSVRKKGLTRNEKNRILNVYKSVTGQVDYWDTAGIQQVYDATKLSQAMAHLPLATISSLTEIIIPFTRSTPDKATSNLLKSMNGYHKHVTEDLKTILRDKHGMKEPEMIKEMQSVFLAVDESLADRIESLAGEGIQTEWVKKGGRMFFKANFLTDWTRFVQLTSFNVGKDIVHTNLTKLNKAVKGGKALEGMSRGKLGRYKEELFELGIDIKKGLKWVDDGAKTTDEFYTKDLMRSAGRFTNEVILNPSREKALKPVIQSNPKADILFQFLGYPTAFSNTVMKNAIRAIVRDPLTNSPRVLVGGMIMTQFAMWLNYWRSTPEQHKLIKNDREEVLKGLQRVGALGPMEHAYRYGESLAYTKSPLASVALLGGPILEDVVGTLAYRRGLAQNIVRNLPGYGARGVIENITGMKPYSNILEGSKQFDKNLLRVGGITKPPKTGLEIDTSIRYAEGGRVGYAEGYEVSVPFAKEEPEERVNPYTGEPYTAIYKKPRVGLVAGGVSKLIQKFFAKTPVKRATDKKWTNLSITDESDKVVGLVKNIPASPGNSYIRAKTPEFRQYLIDNQIGRQSKTVDSQFYFDTSSQKAINKLLNKPFNK